VSRVVRPTKFGELMTTTAKRGAKASPRLTRRQQVLERFIAGARVEAIAEAVHLPAKQVEKLLSGALKKLDARPAAEFVKVQLERIERVLGALSEKISAGDIAAIETYLRTLDRAERYYRLLQRLGVEYEEAARKSRAAAEKVTRLLLSTTSAPAEVEV